MGIFKGILKGGVSVDKVFDTVSKGLDNLSLSPQERADNVREFVKDTLSENSARSVARRIIAIIIIVNFVLAFWLTVILYFKNPDSVQVIIEIIKAFRMDVAFMAVIAFFFGGYYLSKAREKRRDKKGTT